MIRDRLRGIARVRTAVPDRDEKQSGTRYRRNGHEPAIRRSSAPRFLEPRVELRPHVSRRRYRRDCGTKGKFGALIGGQIGAAGGATLQMAFDEPPLRGIQ